jgi:prepilin-type N-terminal cleavage/methylation domain-containing protein
VCLLLWPAFFSPPLVKVSPERDSGIRFLGRQSIRKQPKIASRGGGMPLALASPLNDAAGRRCRAPPLDHSHFDAEQHVTRTALRARRAFTIVELLVVIAVIGILVALLLPAVQMARESANRMSCQNNLKQIGLAVRNYEVTFRAMPPRRNLTAGYTRGWGPSILPYVEQEPLRGNYRFDKDFYAPENAANIAANLPIFLCPSSTGPRMITVVQNGITAQGAAGDYFGPNSFASSKYGIVSLSANVQVTAMDDIVRPRRLADIRDGLSSTLLITEQAGRADFFIHGKKQASNAGLSQAQSWGPWASYQVFQVEVFGADGITKDGPGDTCTINCNNSQGVYSFHPGGAEAVFVDGSVHLLPESLDPNILFALVTINGGEAITNNLNF